MLDQRAEVHLVVYKTHLLQMNEERSIYNSKYIVTLSTPHEFNGIFGVGTYAIRTFATPFFVTSATPLFVTSATPFFRTIATRTFATPKNYFFYFGGGD